LFGPVIDTVVVVNELRAEDALLLGGWDDRYACVRATATRDDMAAAIVDSNGDSRDVDLDLYRWTGDRWEETSSSCIDDEGWCWVDGTVALFGRSEPGAEVRVDHDGAVESVTASKAGWWLWIGPGEQGSKPNLVV